LQESCGGWLDVYVFDPKGGAEFHQNVRATATIVDPLCDPEAASALIKAIRVRGLEAFSFKKQHGLATMREGWAKKVPGCDQFRPTLIVVDEFARIVQAVKKPSDPVEQAAGGKNQGVDKYLAERVPLGRSEARGVLAVPTHVTFSADFRREALTTRDQQVGLYKALDDETGQALEKSFPIFRKIETPEEARQIAFETDCALLKRIAKSLVEGRGVGRWRLGAVLVFRWGRDPQRGLRRGSPTLQAAANPTQALVRNRVAQHRPRSAQG
jgi:hypothetical protein